MSGQQYQGKFTEVILRSIELGDRTVGQLTEQRDRHQNLINRGLREADDQYISSCNEALTVLQTQQ
jgi:hypothetical protein